MAKRILTMVVLAALAAQGVFAQEEILQGSEEEVNESRNLEKVTQKTTDDMNEVDSNANNMTDFAAMAKNTILVDVGPTIIGAAIGVIGRMIGEDSDFNTSGFGIAAQYERQLSRKLSVAGRFAYLGGSLGIAQEEYDQGAVLKAELGMKLSSFSLEGHARYYPFGKTFFLDGMLGYANMSANFSGAIIGTDKYGHKEKIYIPMYASQGFFKFGAKLGWRVSFGKNGGFTFEPSLGYYSGIGMGDTIGEQLSKKINKDFDVDVDISDFDEIFGYIQKFIFIGGPRLTLAFGYRF